MNGSCEWKETSPVLVQCGVASYEGLDPPFSPSEKYPELPFLKKETLSRTTNRVYAGVRRLLEDMGLDRAHAGTEGWNPLGDLVGPGQTVVMKPNLVRDKNPQKGGTTDSLVTHLSVIRPLVDYAYKAVGPTGRVVICDAPQQDCDMENLRSYWGIDELQAFYEEQAGIEVEFIDLRLEAVTFQDGVITGRRKLPGDPAGYTVFNLGDVSEFAQVTDKLGMLRGADYDHEVTLAHHREGRHEYCISNTVLKADLLINLPKMKTHKKSGVTLALKNLVGINGDKNWLPHFRRGFPEEGGDEFPYPTMRRRIRSWAVERTRRMLKAEKFTFLVRWARRFENALMLVEEERSGNWCGNDTVWRMVMDLNRCLYFGDVEKGG